MSHRLPEHSVTFKLTNLRVQNNSGDALRFEGMCIQKINVRLCDLSLNCGSSLRLSRVHKTGSGICTELRDCKCSGSFSLAGVLVEDSGAIIRDCEVS